MANNWNSFCGCSSRKCSCDKTFQSVEELPTLGEATREHAYILPDNTVWTLNSDGTGFTQLNGGSGGASYDDTAIQERLEALEEKTDNDTIYDDTAIKERLDALEEKTDNDTIYDDSELRDLIQGVADRNTMEDNRLVRIENKNADQDASLEALEDAVAELQNKPEPESKTYTAGPGIAISDDGVITNLVVDTDTDTRYKFTLQESRQLNDTPKKLSDYGEVTTANSALLHNAISVKLPNNVDQTLNEVVLTLPIVNFSIELGGTTQQHNIKNVTTKDSWLYLKSLSSARGHIYVKNKFGVLKMEYDTSSTTNKMLAFEFEFHKLDLDGNSLKIDAQEPTLTVPMTIDNVMNGEAFGANFYDEYKITVTMEEPMIAVNSMDYQLLRGTEVIK